MAEEYEKKTPVFDWEKGDFATDPQKRIVTATRNAAIEQIVIKVQQTKRGTYFIYADIENADRDHKYGSDVHDILTRRDLSEEARLSELKRTTHEASIHDPWVKAVTDVTIQRQGSDEVTFSGKIKTIFDTEVDVAGVSIANG